MVEQVIFEESGTLVVLVSILDQNWQNLELFGFRKKQNSAEF